jgi:prepilin-type N-terminal cleavage/methylation domain-containing protein
MRCKIANKNNRGMTLVEIMVGMTVFAVGLLGLSRVLFSVMHSNLTSKNTVIATNLAHQRMEQISGSLRYSAITSSNFPSEDYSEIGGGAEEYAHFRRTVAIDDSLNAVGNSVIKEVTVRVEWRDRGGVRNVELKSCISRFKDINL